MNLAEVYDKIAQKKPTRVVLQFTNFYLGSARRIEDEFKALFPDTKFYISADK